MLLIGTLLLVASLSVTLHGLPVVFRAGKQWMCVLAGVLLGACALASLRWDATSRMVELSPIVGLAVMLCAGVVLVRGGRLAMMRESGRRSGVVKAAAAALAILAVGWGIKVGPQVREIGWWMALPRPLRIEVSPWLSDQAVGSIWPTYRAGEDGPRDPLWGWEKVRLRARLEERVRKWRSLESLREYLVLERKGTTHEELGCIVFKALIDRFCDGTDDDRLKTASDLRNFVPEPWKSQQIAMSQECDTLATRGRVPRLLELSRRSSEPRISIEMLCLCGEEAVIAVPRLFELAVTGDRANEPVYEAEGALRYLARHEPGVREQVFVRLESSERRVRLIAIESLAQFGWRDEEVITRLSRLKSHEDVETAKAAAEALSRNLQ